MKRKLNKRAVALLVSLAVILTVTAGVTLAIIFTNTDALENIFTPAQVSCDVVESDGGAIAVENTGTASAYIRAAIVVTWKDANGNVYAKKPADAEYTLDLDLANGWKQGSDGYYYYTSPVAPADTTRVLVTSADVKDGVTGPVGADGTQYYLSIEIVASAIQATPTSVVTQQWSSGISGVDGTTLKVKEATA